jgi:catechol 2,3-dioxygenase-like lactoylglutathione lyase family enzyme
MQLGAFSISLAVKDLDASQAFYRALGFEIVGGDAQQNWLIMRNGDHTIGLFQGMFESNLMTFNPGWDRQGNAMDGFSDIRDIHARLAAAGIGSSGGTIDTAAGPASFTVEDPDGNIILFDQHV